MSAGCENTCPKVKQKIGSGSSANRTEDLNGSSKSRRSPPQSQKSVHIGGVTSVEVIDYRSTGSTGSSDNTPSTKDSYTSTESAKRSTETSSREAAPKVQHQTDSKSSTRSTPSKESSQGSERSSNHSRMSPSAGSSSRSGTRADWNPNGHDPCPPSCPMTQARERATRRAELRQERLDDYLLNKGLSYFDDLCTCSSICLFNQLRRDRFVMTLLKSTFLFGIGMKLCEELDAWNIIG